VKEGIRMFHNRLQAPRNTSPVKTAIGVIGILFGIIFLLQAFNIINFSFEANNNVYLKIFAAYAILSGIILATNIQRRAIIRY
jgi:uncharacterized membrane protein YcjF (UPF0283 family)